MHNTTTQKPAGSRAHLAGAFDIRNVIGALIGLYGVILVVCSFALDPGINPDTGVVKNAQDNLWAGLAMVIVGVVFFAWAKLRPIVIEESVGEK